MDVAHPSLAMARCSEVEVVVSNTFSLEASSNSASGDTDGVNGKELDSWKHLLDAIGGGLPSFLSSSVFAALLNTPGLRTGLKVGIQVCWKRFQKRLYFFAL